MKTNGIAIIIESKGMGRKHMAPPIPVCDCILKGKEDGDKVKVEVEGFLVEHNGKRFIEIETVDGEPLEEMPDMGDEMEDFHEKELDMSAEESLMHFMKNLKKK